ncbi:hypothetical protein [Vampirovibrio chlorellavorus]|uniref:hypothetical protein n=1 Tax=Vampirovibrio chlorellavorus TaxID=758823 RepID=UPI0026EAAB06|nr:hypothetical protein [Vampirovibrio chlorellavorus]
MTLLLNDPFGNERGSTGSDEDSGLSSFIRSLGQTQLNFWGGPVATVLRLLSQTVTILAREGFSRLRQNLGLLQRTSKRTYGLPVNGKAAERPVALQAPGPLSVYKVHGALGERWTQSSDQRPIRLNRGKQNPWMAAEIKNTAVVIRPFQPEESEIRGLDDIFTDPVQGSFLDVIQPQGPAVGKRKRHGLKPANAPGRPPERHGQSHVGKPEPQKQDSQKQEPAVVQEVDRMTTLAERQQRLKAETRKLSKRVKRVADSTKDWFSRQEAGFANVAAQLSEKIPSPYQSYATEGEVVFAPVPPSPTSSAWQVLQSEQSLATARTNPAWLQTSVQVSSIPREQPLSGPSAEFNGFDYMVQNNRILSRSISNLVDRYFDQNALSEDSA